jgi:DNA polymerase-3 subunit delta'
MPEEETQPCGQCQDCRLFDAGTHPDFHVLTTEVESENGRLPILSEYSNRYLDSKEREKKTKYSRVIGVDQVRELIERFSTHAHISKSKVALVLPADCMNISAANALLKLLEEPPAGSVIVLATANPAHLPATIRSRCMVQNLGIPERREGITWLSQYLGQQNSETALDLASGAPVEAKRLAESGFLEHYQLCLDGFAALMNGQLGPIELSGQLGKIDFELLLLWFHRFISEIIKLLAANIIPAWVHKMDIDIRNIRSDRLYGLYDRICYYRRIEREPLNEQLVIEDLVLAFYRTVI